jgi:hypothetical protein
MRTFFGKPIVLRIEEPGELYLQQYLEGSVEVSVTGLLSGLSVRYYDAKGARSRNPSLREWTQLVMRVRLFLDDAFTGRLHSPYQQLHFDELVPEDMRISDIVGILTDRGFRITDSPGAHGDARVVDGDHEYALIRCHKQEGPEAMNLWVFVEGEKHRTQRSTEHGVWKYESSVASGEMKVFVYGELPGSGDALLRQMNELHAALRERFAPLRARK